MIGTSNGYHAFSAGGFGLLLLAILSSATCTSQKHEAALLSIPAAGLPLRLELVRRYPNPPNAANRIADLDNDGVSDFLNVATSPDTIGKSPSQVTWTDLDQILAGTQRNFRGLISATCFDWDRDNRLEVFVDEQLGDDNTLHVFDYRGDSLAVIPLVKDAPAAVNPVWRCNAWPAGLIDGNRDGRPDLLVILATNEAYQPRMIKLIDSKTLKTIWEFPCGTVIERLFVADANLDGEEEIYCKTNAPGNGIGEPVNGTDDGHSWFIILSASGKPLQKVPMGGEFSSFIARPVDMDHDNRPKVVLIRMSRNKYLPEKSMIAFWDPVQRRMLSRKEYDNHLIDECCFLDVNGDGRDELIVFWSNGTIEARSSSNAVFQSVDLGESLTGSPVVEDLNNDGDPELLIAGKSAVFVFSRSLKLLARYPGDFPTVESAATGRGKPKAIIVRTGLSRLILSIRPNYAAPLELSWPLIAAFASGAVFVLLLLHLRRQRQRKDPRYWARQALFDHLEAGLIVLDHSGEVLFINDRLRQLLERQEDPVLPCDRRSLLPDPRFLALNEWIDSHQQTGSALPLHLEKVFPAREIQATLRGLRDHRGRQCGVLILLQDITSQRQSSRAIAWTRLAQRLAHQIKTPLSSVLLAVQRLQMEYQRDGIGKARVYDRYVDYVAEEVARIREITDGFLKFAQLEPPRLAPVEINPLILATLDKYRQTLAGGVEIQADLDPAIGKLLLDEEQIRIVLGILIENSLEAMEGHGKLTLTSRLRQGFAEQAAGMAEESLLIECADTGPGMTAETVAKLFDPFFTTKARGTGLGLPIARRIVEDHSGSIEVRSRKGIGTVVAVSLPRLQD